MAGNYRRGIGGVYIPRSREVLERDERERDAVRLFDAEREAGLHEPVGTHFGNYRKTAIRYDE